MRPYSDSELPIIQPEYAPRGDNPIPTVDIDQSPFYCAKINQEWFSHILGVLSALDQPDAWAGSDVDIDYARNEIRRFIASWSNECMTVISSVVPYAGTLLALPSWCLPCDGSQYLRADYPLLYASIDPVYHVDADNFTTPDTRSRLVVGDGTGSGLSNRVIGGTGGAETHQLTVDEMPSHNHSYNQFSYGLDIESVGIPDPTGVGQPELPRTTGNRGGNQAHENMPPFLVLRHYIVARYP
jgi:microcystin-dependent protein